MNNLFNKVKKLYEIIKKHFHTLELGDLVVINNNSTYFGLTGKFGTVVDINKSLFSVMIDSRVWFFTEDALDYLE
jgi:hypothetical protein